LIHGEVGHDGFSSSRFGFSEKEDFRSVYSKMNLPGIPKSVNVVILLPLTIATENILNEAFFQKLFT